MSLLFNTKEKKSGMKKRRTSSSSGNTSSSATKRRTASYHTRQRKDHSAENNNPEHDISTQKGKCILPAPLLTQPSDNINHTYSFDIGMINGGMPNS